MLKLDACIGHVMWIITARQWLFCSSRIKKRSSSMYSLMKYMSAKWAIKHTNAHHSFCSAFCMKARGKVSDSREHSSCTIGREPLSWWGHQPYSTSEQSRARLAFSFSAWRYQLLCSASCARTDRGKMPDCRKRWVSYLFTMQKQYISI